MRMKIARLHSDLPRIPEVDGMESLLIALASEGIDLSDERVQRAVQATLDTIDNNG